MRNAAPIVDGEPRDRFYSTPLSKFLLRLATFENHLIKKFNKLSKYMMLSILGIMEIQILVLSLIKRTF